MSKLHIANAEARRILIVDDDPSVGEALVRVLSLVGYSAWAATSGDEALLIAKYLRFDLVLLDLHLPEKDGWQIFAGLRAGDPQLAAIIITAQPDERSRAAPPGVRGFFEKPLDFPVLLQAVSRALAPVAGQQLSPS